MRLGLILAVLLTVLTSAPADAATDSERYFQSERVLRYDYNILITNPEWIDAAANPELAEAAAIAIGCCSSLGEPMAISSTYPESAPVR